MHEETCQNFTKNGFNGLTSNLLASLFMHLYSFARLLDLCVIFR